MRGVPVERAELGYAGGVGAVAAAEGGGDGEAEHAVARQLHRVEVAVAPAPLSYSRMVTLNGVVGVGVSMFD